MSSLIKFTAPDGSPVYLVDTWIIKVIRNTEIDQDKAPTRIWFSGGVQAVKEPVSEVVSAVQKAFSK